MRRHDSEYPYARPSRRPLKIFASDPMRANQPGSRITIDIENEQLSDGPIGSRFLVIDYDGGRDCYYPPVNLDDPAILMQGGLEPAESDPRFHQQMVYAVAMRTLENFETALGRRLEFRRRKCQKLRILPHAFHGANAAYDPELNALLFGYFRASTSNPGPNLPGQSVFTCLSHDIIAHELTHAIVDRLRVYSREPSNPDVLAFHEGFSDIVALFQHFSYREFLREQIQATKTDIRQSRLLVDIAQQFGYATGINRALRSAIGDANVRLTESTIEVHDRGAVLVAAVFDAFFAIYQARIQDLLRIASGGTGILPQGALHPDLVNRLSAEASKIAQTCLVMCIRALDYLPPVDITFGDYLRGLVTADYELVREDQGRVRGAMIESFRARGIYPEGVASLAEESLIWQEGPRTLPAMSPGKIRLANEIALAASAYNLDPQRRLEGKADAMTPGGSWGSRSFDEDDAMPALARSLRAYALENARQLNLDPERNVHVARFHTIFRVAPSGQLLTELVVQYLQKDDSAQAELGGIPFRGGTTIIAGTDGRIRYVISKPLPSSTLGRAARQDARRRLERQKQHLVLSDMADPRSAYEGEGYAASRALIRARLSTIHEGAVQ